MSDGFSRLHWLAGSLYQRHAISLEERALIKRAATIASKAGERQPRDNMACAFGLFANGHGVKTVIEATGCSRASAFRWQKLYREKYHGTPSGSMSGG